MSRISFVTAGVAIASVAVATAFAEPSVGPAKQAHGGNGRGKNIMSANDDLFLTEVTRVELSFDKQVSDLANARNALNLAAFRSPANSPDLQAKAKAVADADLALALKRAEAFQALKSKLNITAPEKTMKLVQAMGGGGGGGRGGG